MNEEQFEQIKTIVRETLAERFKDEFVFDPIVVVPAIDEWGDGDGEHYLRIIIVFDGDLERLDPSWTSGLIRRLRPKLSGIGVEQFPSPSFVEKSEWRSLSRKWQRRHPELSIETG